MIRVRVIAPSRTLPRKAADITTRLVAAEFAGQVSLEIDDRCFLEHGHFAGPDMVRCAALLEALTDPSVDAIWLARGGYGACRILPHAAAAVLPQTSKPLLGYSDGGFLLSALGQIGVCAPVHAPMVADGLRDGGEAALRRVLLYLLGDRSGVEPQVGQPSRSVAFTLAVLASLVAGPYMMDLDGKELLIEDVGEHLYAIDRMLFTVFSSGRLAGAKGLRLGRFSDIPENDVPFGEGLEAMIARWCAQHGVPYLGRADIGHDVGNRIVPFPRD